MDSKLVRSVIRDKNPSAQYAEYTGTFICKNVYHIFRTIIMICRILSSHNGDYEELYLPGYNAV
jgi:hypothetical protein